DVRPDAVGIERPQHADMGKAARGAAAESEPDRGALLRARRGDCVVDVAVGLPSPDVQGTTSAARSGSRICDAANQPQNQPLIALRDRTATPPCNRDNALGPQRVPEFM